MDEFGLQDQQMEDEAIQLEFPFPVPPARTAAGALEAAAAALFPEAAIAISYLESCPYLISAAHHPCHGLSIKAQMCFKSAPEAVARAVIRLYLGRPPKRLRRQLSSRVHGWYQTEATPPPSPPASSLLLGDHQALPSLFERVNARWFSASLNLDLSFGPRLSRRIMARHERRAPRGLILVNPILDHPKLEPWYLEYLLFHEGLHEIIRPRSRNGRLEIHPPEFLRREREHPDVARARDYESWITGSGFPELKRAHQERLRRRQIRRREALRRRGGRSSQQ